MRNIAIGGIDCGLGVIITGVTYSAAATSPVVHYAVFGGLGAIAFGTGIWGILAGRK